jgi:hypothetical protein
VRFARDQVAFDTHKEEATDEESVTGHVSTYSGVVLPAQPRGPLVNVRTETERDTYLDK